MTFRLYVPAVPPCSGKAQTGTRNLQAAILHRFEYATPLGIYNCRPVSGGVKPSIHSDGRAGDTGFPVEGGRPHWQGYLLVEQLRQNAWDLGVMGIIWNRRRWDWRTPWGRTYNGPNPHFDHVHWEQEPNLAQTLSLETARRLIGEPPMSFTSNEEAVLKLLVQGLTSPGPSTGKVGNGLSLIHVLETYRITASRSGTDPTDHSRLAEQILGY